MSHLLLGANSTRGIIQRTERTQDNGRIRLVTYTIAGTGSTLILPVERNQSGAVFAVRIDEFFNKGSLNQNDPFIVTKTNLGGYNVNNDPTFTPRFSYDNSIKEIRSEGEVNDYILPTDPDNYERYDDIDNDKIPKFLDPDNANRLTYVMNQNINYICIVASEFYSRADYRMVDIGLLGVAKPSGTYNGVDGNNFEFINKSADLGKIRSLVDEIHIDFLHESIISNYDPMLTRIRRPIYFSIPYLITLTVYFRGN